MKKNSVVFKGRNDGIMVILADDIPFDELKEQLARKLDDAKNFFDSAKASIKFSGRSLTEKEELELIDIIKNGADLTITFVGSGDRMRTKVEKVAADIFDSKKNMTYFHTGALRGGQEIHYAGSVVIVGDVNPGAEIIAEGNIVVVGALKGLVHAGCKGAEGCFVLAAAMNPTQLRIADIITYLPDDPKRGRKRLLEFAYVQDGQIYIAPLE